LTGLAASRMPGRTNPNGTTISRSTSSKPGRGGPPVPASSRQSLKTPPVSLCPRLDGQCLPEALAVELGTRFCEAWKEVDLDPIVAFFTSPYRQRGPGDPKAVDTEHHSCAAVRRVGPRRAFGASLVRAERRGDRTGAALASRPARLRLVGPPFDPCRPLEGHDVRRLVGRVVRRPRPHRPSQPRTKARTLVVVCNRLVACWLGWVDECFPVWVPAARGGGDG
jgi:hypothetical protein